MQDRQDDDLGALLNDLEEDREIETPRQRPMDIGIHDRIPARSLADLTEDRRELGEQGAPCRTAAIRAASS
jgi:hypothetical protein